MDGVGAIWTKPCQSTYKLRPIIHGLGKWISPPPKKKKSNVYIFLILGKNVGMCECINVFQIAFMQIHCVDNILPHSGQNADKAWSHDTNKILQRAIFLTKKKTHTHTEIFVANLWYFNADVTVPFRGGVRVKGTSARFASITHRARTQTWRHSDRPTAPHRRPYTHTRIQKSWLCLSCMHRA